MTKKVALAAATPDDDNRYSLKDEHDYLTPKLGREPVLAIVELGVAIAGGHDEQGNQMTTLRIRHLEHARTPEQREKVEELFTELHHDRTGNAERPSGEKPKSDAGNPPALAGLEGENDGVES